MTNCPHFDLTDPDTYHGGQPREIYKYLRQEQPVYWHEDPVQGVGFWVITRQADLDFVSKNPLLFSSRERSCLPMEPDEETLPLMQTQRINMDPPQHLKYRRLVRNAFTPKAVDSYEERFRDIARGIVDQAVAGGHCEFVSDVAAELPLIAICELMGVPLEQRQRLFELTNIMLGMDDPELSTSAEDGTNAMIEMFMMAMAIAATHRAEPRDDIVNVLLHHDRAHRDDSVGQALGRGEDIRSDAEPFGSERGADAAKGGNHLVENQQDAMLGADFQQALEIADRRWQNPGRTRNGLDNHRGDVGCIMQRAEPLQLIRQVTAPFRLALAERIVFQVPGVRQMIDRGQQAGAKRLAVGEHSTH